jgi:nucleotide-binding universal stress UspA family protein
MFRRVLFGTDFSPASRPAFRRAVALARQFRGRLLIVHVIPSGMPVGAEGYVTPRIYQEMETAIRQSAQKQLDRLVAQAKKAGVAVRGLLLSGAAPEAIALTARKERSDVVIVGTHGRTGLERLLAGSVASRIVGTAPCPVLTVRPR